MRKILYHFRLTKIILFLFINVFHLASNAQDNTYIASEYSKKIFTDGGGFVFAVHFREFNSMMFFCKKKVYIKKPGHDIFALPENSSKEIMDHLTYISFYKEWNGSLLTIEKGAYAIFKANHRSLNTLLKVDIKKEEIFVLQDFTDFRTTYATKQNTSNYAKIEHFTQVKNNNVYCYMKGSPSHVLSIDVESGDWTNLTEDLLGSEKSENGKDFDRVEKFQEVKDGIYFMHNEIRYASDGLNYIIQYRVTYVDSSGVRPVEFGSEQFKRNLGPDLIYDDDDLILVFAKSLALPPFDSLVYTVLDNVGSTLKSDILFDYVHTIRIPLKYHDVPSTIYQKNNYFFNNSELVHLTRDGEKLIIQYPEEVELKEFIDFPFDSTSLFLHDDQLNIWRYHKDKWTDLKIFKQYGPTVVGNKDTFFIEGYKLNSKGETVNGIYEFGSRDTAVLQYKLGRVSHLMLFDKHFYYSDNTGFHQLPMLDKLKELNIASAVTEIDIGSSTEFVDNSVGDITKREWYFEGGEPETATTLKPVVQYNTAGNFNVGLKVTYKDGKSKEFLWEHHMTVIDRRSSSCPIPGKPNFGLVNQPYFWHQSVSLGVNWPLALYKQGRTVHYMDRILVNEPTEYYNDYEVFYRRYRYLEPWQQVYALNQVDLFGHGNILLQGLYPDTDYEVNVTTLCSENVNSHFSRTSIFHTPAPVPFVGKVHKNSNGEVSISPGNPNDFKDYDGFWLRYIHLSLSGETADSAYFTKDQAIVIKPGRSGYYKFYLKYDYIGLGYSNYGTGQLTYIEEPQLNPQNLTGGFTFKTLLGTSSGKRIQFFSLDSTRANKFVWDFSGGYVQGNADNYNPEVYFPNGVVSDISLTVYNNENDSVSYTLNNLLTQLGSDPYVQITKRYPYVGELTSFKVVSDTTESKYSWQIKGAEPSLINSAEAIVSFNNPGKYVAVLKEIKDNIQSEFTYDISVNSKTGLYPSIEFSAWEVYTGAPIIIKVDTTGMGYLGIHWTINGGSPEKSQQAELETMWNEPGIYNVDLILFHNSGEVLTVSKEIEVLPGANGLKDQIISAKPALYPNPVLNSFEIKLDKVYSNASVQIYDMKGRLVDAIRYSDIKTISHKMESPPGIYILKLTIESQVFNLKMVKN